MTIPDIRLELGDDLHISLAEYDRGDSLHAFRPEDQDWFGKVLDAVTTPGTPFTTEPAQHIRIIEGEWRRMASLAVLGPKDAHFLDDDTWKNYLRK